MTITTTLRAQLVMGLATLVAFAWPHTAHAAGVVGTGSVASCTDAALNTALAGGGLVTFNCGGDAGTIDISPGAGGTGTKTIAADTTIDGGGIITISGGNSAQVIRVNSGVTFTVQNLTIANGNSAVDGGGISNNGGTLTVTNSSFSGNSAADIASGAGGAIANLNLGTLTVTNSTFSGNSAAGISNGGGGGISNNGGTLTVTNSTFSGNNTAGAGGAIINGGTLTVTNSTFSGNSADHGGAISIVAFSGSSSATLTVTNSTFSDNTASGSSDSQPSGGAISNFAGTLTVANSTFSGNSAIYAGGGIANVSTLTVTNCTFSGNSAISAGGGIANGGTVTVTNTLVANSTSGGNCASFGASVTDGGHNIDDGTTCGFTGTGCTSTSGSSFCSTNPQLNPAGLVNNGGPTQTIALEPGSPAINAGDQTVCANAPVNGVDQRGYVRPGTGHTNCSIGAYEVDSTAPEACVGDCDDSGDVTVNELITMVNIALGNALLSACPVGDADGSGDITVNEIIQAVRYALTNCPAP